MVDAVRIANYPSSPAQVDPVGIIGSQYQVTLLSAASAADPNPATTGEVWTSSAGFKQATFWPAAAIGTSDRIVIRYGTAETTAIEAEVSDIHSTFTTVTEVSYPNTIVLTAVRPTATIRWDGGTTIKRVSVGGSNATAAKVNMEYIA